MTSYLSTMHPGLSKVNSFHWMVCAGGDPKPEKFIRMETSPDPPFVERVLVEQSTTSILIVSKVFCT